MWATRCLVDAIFVGLEAQRLDIEHLPGEAPNTGKPPKIHQKSHERPASSESFLRARASATPDDAIFGGYEDRRLGIFSV